MDTVVWPALLLKVDLLTTLGVSRFPLYRPDLGWAGCTAT